MKRNKVSILLAALLLIGGSAYAEETEMPAAEASSEGAENAGELSDDWKDYQIQIDGQVYQFPMMYSDFAAMGWSADADIEIQPNQYTWVTATNGDLSVTIDIINLGLNTAPAEECIVGSIEIESSDSDTAAVSVILPGGIEMGKADVAAIEAAYGTPSDTYEGDMYDQLTYETDIYSEMELKVYKESGVLEAVDIRNFVEPENFDAGEVSDEVPEAVTAYTKPDSLSEDLSDYQIEVDGVVYSMPVPVSVLIADGWELDENASDPVIAARDSGWVTVRKGGQEIDELAHNYEDYATTPENCWIREISIGEYETNVPGKLPGGITTGMAETEFVGILEAAGVTYELNDNGDYKYYSFSNPEYGIGYEATVYAGDDGVFEKDTIMEITCNNELE